MQNYFLMGVASSGIGLDVITWSADVRGAMTTLQLSALVFFLSPAVICLSLALMNSLFNGGHAVPSSAILSARSILSQGSREKGSRG